MTEEHLRLLDFILPILSENYPNSIKISSLTHQYKKTTGIKFDYKQESFFVDSYDYQYFIKSGQLNHLTITPETKKIIDTYLSLSKYLIERQKIDKRKRNKRSLLKTTPIIVSVLMLILSIILAILNSNQTKQIDKLENELNKKDSIILELNNRIKNLDSIKNKGTVHNSKSYPIAG